MEEPVFGVDERGARATRGRRCRDEPTYLIVSLTFASHSRPPSFFTNTIESWIDTPFDNIPFNQLVTS
jgi:hypothetical protein